MLWDLGKQSADITLTSDASGSWGCGEYCENRWFHFKWSTQLMHLPIATKEMIPIVISAAIYGSQWTGKIVHFHTDSMAVVHVVNSLFCNNSHLMHLIRLLVFFASYHNFWFLPPILQGYTIQQLMLYLAIICTLSFYRHLVPTLRQESFHPY